MADNRGPPCCVALTALVCTYNNANVLASTLEHLARQNIPANIAWEVIVVDNNCTDQTRDVVQRIRGTLPALQLLSELKQGVGHARRAGMRVARGELIAFVDDDCWLAADWVAQAIQFAAEHPRAGAFGGRNSLLWIAPPPVLAADYGESLARQDFGDADLRFPDEGKRVPCGAGIVLRREALLDSRWLDDGRLRGRDPRHVGAGEDTEIVLRIRNAGWQVWYTPRLQLQHVIPPQRTTLSYLRRLHRGFGRAEVFLRNISLRRDHSWHSRCDGLFWALREMLVVWQRFYRGYVRLVGERPSWLIRLSFATGCIEGALRFLVSGSAR